MDALQKANQEMNNIIKHHRCSNISHVTSNIHLCMHHICLSKGLPHIYETSSSTTMDYVDAATTHILSPDIISLEELKGMLRHIESQLSSIMHLPISLDTTLHFYRYLKTHVLVAEEQFLLLIDVSIQGRAQQLQIYEIFNLPVTHGDMSARYKITDKYIGITYDETQAVVITELQYSTCLHANSQLCKVNTPFQALTNPPTCTMALYAKNNKEIEAQCFLLYFTHHPLSHLL